MDTITKQLSERITSYLLAGGLVNPELANHSAVRDLLIDCRAALDTLPVQQARQPLTQVSIEKLFCTRIDIRHDEFTAAMPDTFRQGQWFRRGWQAAQDYFGITGEQP